ncbi:hypothetical protein M8C21_014799 [Ambrosia artemisiifolia]|nr:hypothetical protein M8C21_014799 [Ambrosia artemisiifolia]
MEKISNSSSIFLIIVLLLLVPFEEESNNKNYYYVVEARTCESQSHGFKGRCMSNHNCGLVCRNEGFSAGNCRGARGRCFCTKTC